MRIADHWSQRDMSDEYSESYDEDSFWKKVRNFAIRAGREVIRRVLILYHTLRDPDTPTWANSVIVGALGYFIMPVDAIPDVIPVAGFSDDLGVVALAAAQVAAHIKTEHKQAAEEKLREWFGDDSGDREDEDLGGGEPSR